MRVCSFALASLVLFGGIACAAGQDPRILTIKAPDIVLPEGVPPGQYRRIVQPFENWVLICDENLHEMTRICNVTQSIVDQTDRVVFSWSVAATQEGRPFMIVRTLAALGEDGVVTLGIPDGQAPVRIAIEGCNGDICLGRVPIGPRLRPQVANGGVIGISYQTALGETIEIAAPLSGIEDALNAIE